MNDCCAYALRKSTFYSSFATNKRFIDKDMINIFVFTLLAQKLARIQMTVDKDRRIQGR